MRDDGKPTGRVKRKWAVMTAAKMLRQCEPILLDDNSALANEVQLEVAEILDEIAESMTTREVGHPRQNHYKWLVMFLEKQQELKAQGVRDHAKRAYKHVAGQVHVEADTVKRTINNKFGRVLKHLRKKGR